LADMMSVGTLNAYSLVSLSVLILRYHEDFDKNGIPLSQVNEAVQTSFNDSAVGSPSPSSEFYSLRNRTVSPPMATTPDEVVFDRCRADSVSKKKCSSITDFLRQIFNQDHRTSATPLTVAVAKTLIVVTVALAILLDVFLIAFADDLYNLKVGIWVAVGVTFILNILGLIAISRQPAADKYLPFKVPCVPLIPYLSIVSNMYLALSLSSITWIRFAIWFVIGMFIYLGYGIWNSSERLRKDLKKQNTKTVQFLNTSQIPRLNIIEATPDANVKVY